MIHLYKKLNLVLFMLLGTSTIAQNESDVKVITNPKLKLKAVAEIGFLGVWDHTVQFSKSGTNFNYKESGGQDVLFPISRISLELNTNSRNTFVLLYQPLSLESQVLLSEDLIVDDLLFPANSSVKLLYNFPFYRASYLRELTQANKKFSFAIGPTLQIRNATISFESADGTLFRTNRNLGLVPALKIKSKYYLSDKFYTEIEADGIYAPISYLNGSDNEVVGAILDASLRFGFNLNTSVSSFLNLRYLGGGAVGTSDVNGPGDGYVKNWLHFSTVSVGFVYAFY